MFKNLNGGRPLNKFQMRILGIEKFKPKGSPKIWPKFKK
jgi:hypothetical protein